MDPWVRRLERAEELARLYPVSAELMYFYRDIARFQAAMQEQNVAPLLALNGPIGEFFARVVAAYPPVAGNWSESCGECGRNPVRVYSDNEFAHIRIEACDRCGIYWKAVDLAKDPAAVPEIDDLASVPLDLWAVRQGYRKPVPNLFGL